MFIQQPEIHTCHKWSVVQKTLTGESLRFSWVVMARFIFFCNIRKRNEHWGTHGSFAFPQVNCVFPQVNHVWSLRGTEAQRAISVADCIREVRKYIAGK